METYTPIHKRIRAFDNADEPLQKRPILLAIHEKYKGYPKVVAVDEEGRHVATLVEFSSRGVYLCKGVKRRLQKYGYDVDVLSWDGDGAISSVPRMPR